MKKLNQSQLCEIIGGSNYLSGSIINAFVNVIKLLVDAGNMVGSSIRRVAEHNVCPLE